jgi:hypothetical protein
MPGILASQSDAVPVGRRDYRGGRGKGILSCRVQVTFSARAALRRTMQPKVPVEALSPAEVGSTPTQDHSADLRTRIQRNAEAESLLSSCALGSLECPSDLPRWRLLPSEGF